LVRDVFGSALISLDKHIGSDYMHSDARDTIGSLDDLITSHQATVGHILATTQIAMPFSQFSPPPMMATDLRAWADMLDYPFCKRRISFPFSQTRWGMASTAGAFTDWIVPSDGLCTYFQILHGKQFVVVVTPREKIHMFPIRPPSDDIDFWEYEGMLVKAGQMV
jgi:hypothetical protein